MKSNMAPGTYLVGRWIGACIPFLVTILEDGAVQDSAMLGGSNPNVDQEACKQSIHSNEWWWERLVVPDGLKVEAP